MKKKITLLTMVLITVFAVAMAQQPRHLLSFQSEHQNRIQKIISPENLKSGKIFLENFWKAENLQSRQNVSKGIIWNWDTIVCYDTDNILSHRYTQTLNSTGNSLMELIENWTGITWVNDSRYTNTYDISGNILIKLYEEAGSGGSWVNSTRETFTYDTAGNVLTDIYEYWDEGTWVNGIRITSTYDSGDNLLTELAEYWNDETWENMDRLTYSYNAAGDIATVLYEFWEEEVWVIGARLTYSYNAAGNLLTELYEYWEESAWVNSDRITFSHDASGNILTELYEYWEEGLWENSDRNTYTYDNNGNSITCIYEEWDSGTWQAAIGSYSNIYSEQNIIGEVDEFYRYEASFASFNTDISEINTDNNQIQLFPNPTSDKVTVNVGNEKGEYLIRIYNSLGFMVKSETANRSSYEINTSTLPAGMYVMEITGKDFSGKKKLIINK